MIGPNDLLHPSPALSGVSRFHTHKTPCSKCSISQVSFFSLSPICWRKKVSFFLEISVIQQVVLERANSEDTYLQHKTNYLKTAYPEISVTCLLK
jgi:hypothetical protein